MASASALISWSCFLAFNSKPKKCIPLTGPGVANSSCSLRLARCEFRLRCNVCGHGGGNFKPSAFGSSNGVLVECDGSQKDSESVDEFIVVNFYKLVFIEDPEEEVNRHLSFMQGREIHGRIYVNEEGINAQYSGPSEDALAYVEWLKQDFKFSDILVQITPATNGHAFPRLKLRYKPSLVQMNEGILKPPLLDLSMRATPLAPSEWRRKLDELNKISCTSDAVDSNCILLDVRNGYEWDVGHFHGAQRPVVDCFRSTSYGQSETEVVDSDPLANVDKEKTDVLMYCTGGIRCDVYSTILRQRGFKRLYTLKGGVSHYLQTEGSMGWVGNLFVFDGRLSLPPSTYKSDSSATTFCEKPRHHPFARCYICGSQVSELRHRNCANLDCNLLFLCCSNCVDAVRGCCCIECTSAQRLRPVLPGHLRYQKWHNYRDSEFHDSSQNKF